MKIKVGLAILIGLLFLDVPSTQATCAFTPGSVANGGICAWHRQTNAATSTGPVSMAGNPIPEGDCACQAGSICLRDAKGLWGVCMSTSSPTCEAQTSVCGPGGCYSNSSGYSCGSGAPSSTFFVLQAWSEVLPPSSDILYNFNIPGGGFAGADNCNGVSPFYTGTMGVYPNGSGYIGRTCMCKPYIGSGGKIWNGSACVPALPSVPTCDGNTASSPNLMLSCHYAKVQPGVTTYGWRILMDGRKCTSPDVLASFPSSLPHYNFLSCSAIRRFPYPTFTTCAVANPGLTEDFPPSVLCPGPRCATGIQGMTIPNSGGQKVNCACSDPAAVWDGTSCVGGTSSPSPAVSTSPTASAPFDPLAHQCGTQAGYTSSMPNPAPSGMPTEFAKIMNPMAACCWNGWAQSSDPASRKLDCIERKVTSGEDFLKFYYEGGPRANPVPAAIPDPVKYAGVTYPNQLFMLNPTGSAPINGFYNAKGERCSYTTGPKTAPAQMALFDAALDAGAPPSDVLPNCCNLILLGLERTCPDRNPSGGTQLWRMGATETSGETRCTAASAMKVHFALYDLCDPANKKRARFHEVTSIGGVGNTDNFPSATLELDTLIKKSFPSAISGDCPTGFRKNTAGKCEIN